MKTKSKTYLYVVIATSLTSGTAIMKVPNFDIGFKVIKELKKLEPKEVYTLMSSSTNYRQLKSYSNWSWDFQR